MVNEIVLMRGVIYIIFVVLVIFASCEGPQDLNRPGDKLDGYAILVDTNLIISYTGYYSVSIYNADSAFPFLRVPLRTDSIRGLDRVDFHYIAPFSMDGIPDGKICIAVTWSRYPKVPNEIPPVLGTYGCDTSAACTNHGVVVYPNVQGNFRNIIAWTDTTKRLF